MNKRGDWLQLVQTATLCYEMARTVKGVESTLAVHVLAEAQRVNARGIPKDTEAAAWAFVDYFYTGQARPEWY